MDSLNKYFQEIRKEHKSGDYTELTFRSALKAFIEELNPGLTLSEEKKKIKRIGRPDYTVFKKNLKIGYIETKDLGSLSSEKELKNVLESDQIKRYTNDAIPNLILTDYLRFILIRNKEVRFDVFLITLEDLEKGKLNDEDNLKRFKQILDSFLNYSLPTIKTATDLAYELSKRAKLLRELVKEQLHEDLERIKNDEEISPIYEFYEAFKELIKDAKPDDCVDAYAQTITYGLFLSKIGSHDGLNRDSAATYIPSSIKIIKKIFTNIAGDELPSNCSWIVDEIVDILNAADIQKILSEFVFEGKHYKDPFIHFYEDFLKEYDPEKRKHLGVYYTPEPVVSFITTSINEILKKEFGKNLGFADDSVNVLDFATGTGTFLANAFVLALHEIRKAGLTGVERSKVENHLLKHFYGFEILVSPYVIAHLKLGLLLKKEGHEIHGNERVQVYLTNTLDPQETISSLKGFLKELSHETMMANTIKLEKPILVVMGNPPYSVSSSNKSEWITKLMKDYKKDLNERNIQPLDDDYIKFIRFAQWKIEQNGEGIIGIITNNSYLDGIVHRQMRKELLRTFDKIYIFNLHGDSRKKEVCPDGSKDENVFDIQQGVAISLFIKNGKKNRTIKYYDLYGLRREKYSILYDSTIQKIKWNELNCEAPHNFFCSKDFTSIKKYNSFLSIKDIFKIGSSGINTARDYLLVDFNENEIFKKIESIQKGSVVCAHELDKDLRKKEVIATLKTHSIDRKLLLDYNYRPFDFRKLYFFRKLIDRDRINLMKNFINNSNIGLILRKNPTKIWRHILLTNCPVDGNFLEARSYVFPLYVYNKNENPTDAQITLNGDKLKTISNKESNFTEEFKKFISEQYPNKEISPEEILGYIYAVLHSPAYRKKYQEFLKIDFPRIPFAKDYSKFKKLSELGSKLIELHLMKKNFNKNIANFEISGSNEVKYVKYKDKKVYINEKQYFSNISKEIWDFFIGGYQVLDKWLKSRKGRKLNHTEIETYVKIVNILSETLKMMSEIDQIQFY